jgi:hypothetical protein
VDAQRQNRGNNGNYYQAQALEQIRAHCEGQEGTGPSMETMRATVFHGVNKIGGEYPVRSGLVIGHEPVGITSDLGPGLTGYHVGDRVLVGAITPCGQCRACLSAHWSQCGHGENTEAMGGWRFGNTINGEQAEYLLVPYAQANLAKIPDGVSDEQVVLLADIASTGFSGAESGGVRIGDSVVVFAQGPIGLCATVGARFLGASLNNWRGWRRYPAEGGKADGRGCGAGLPQPGCGRRSKTADGRRCRRGY